MADLTVTIDGHELAANWTDENPQTRDAIAEALPITGNGARWGDELYFETPVDVGAENAQREVPVGALAYWPRGNALCVFWGPTPATTDGSTPTAASPVNVVAQLETTEALAAVDGNAEVSVERAD